MKIVQIITGLYPAGAERIVVNLSKGLKHSGHDPSVVSLQSIPEDSSIVDELRQADIPIYSLNLNGVTPWRFFGLKKIIKEIAREIIHSHLIHVNLARRLFSGKKTLRLN